MAKQTSIERTVSEIARDLQADAGLSGRELARRLGVGHAYLMRRMYGEVDWSASDLVGLSRVLDIPVSQLFPESIR